MSLLTVYNSDNRQDLGFVEFFCSIWQVNKALNLDTMISAVKKIKGGYVGLS